MSAILKKAAERKKHVYLTAFYKGKMMQLDSDRILYISLKKRGCQIWLNQEKDESPINCNSRLADIYAGLEMHNFAYAHNSYIAVSYTHLDVYKRQMPILLTAARWENWNTKALTQPVQGCMSMDTAYIRAALKIKC